MDGLSDFYYSFMFFLLSSFYFFFFYFFYVFFWNKGCKVDSVFYASSADFSELMCSFFTLPSVLTYFLYLVFLYVYDMFFLFINSYLLEHTTNTREKFFFFLESWLNNYSDVFFLFKEGSVSFINFFLCSFVFFFVLSWFLFFMSFYILLLSLVFHFLYSFCYLSSFFYHFNLQLSLVKDSDNNVSSNFHFYFYYFFFYSCMGFHLFFKVFSKFFGF